MSRFPVFSICLLSLFQTAGCSSIMGRAFTVESINKARKGREGPKLDYSGVYPGIQLVGDVLFNSEFTRKVSKKENPEAITPGLKSIIALVAVLDFPFSFPLDTALLPFDALFYFLDSDSRVKKTPADSKEKSLASLRSSRESREQAVPGNPRDPAAQKTR